MDCSGVHRGLQMLSYCLPGKPREELAAIAIGRRDAMLLELRRATLGPVLNAFAVCPGCAEELEFTLNTADLLGAGNEEPHRMHTFQQGAITVICRLPDSTDMEAAATCASVEEAQRTIVARCIDSIETANGAPWGGEIPAAVA